MAVCSVCHGSAVCRGCDGMGTIRVERSWRPCPRCHGSGRCNSCQGHPAGAHLPTLSATIDPAERIRVLIAAIEQLACAIEALAGSSEPSLGEGPDGQAGDGQREDRQHADGRHADGRHADGRTGEGQREQERRARQEQAVQLVDEAKRLLYRAGLG